MVFSVTDQPQREHNIHALVSYLQSGIKQKPGALGIELEHEIVRTDGSPVPYSGKRGIQWVLGQLQSAYPEPTCDDEGDLLGVARPGEAVTLEPAAQVELSAGPFRRLADAQACFERFEELLASVLERADAHVAPVGYHPTAVATDLELIPKQRYEFMNRYLSRVSPFGPRMMRGSTSTQVSIDFTSIDDCLRKLRTAYALVPLLSLMTDNSPVFEGKPRRHRLVRTEIWQQCDPDRCGIIPGVMDPGFTLEQYASFVLDTPAILVPDGKGGWEETARTFGEVYATRPMEHADVEHALSMLFTDVRLKTYLEIRPADAMPIPYVIAYAALIKGIFYAPKSLDRAEGLFEGADAASIEAAKDALMADGYGAAVYGRPVATLADDVVAAARAGLSAEEQPFLDPLAELVSARETLADRAEAR